MGAATTFGNASDDATGKLAEPAADNSYTMMPLAFQFACSLRVTDPTASLSAIEAGLAHHVASGVLHHALLRFDHVGLTVEAGSRDDAIAKVTALLHELGARQVQVFGVLQLTPPDGTRGVGGR